MSITKTAPLRAELSLEWCPDVTYRCLYVRKGEQLLQHQYTKKTTRMPNKEHFLSRHEQNISKIR